DRPDHRRRDRQRRPEQPRRNRRPGVRRDGESRLMAQKKPAETAAAPRARLEVEFEQPHLLGPLFGEFDRNLVAIEDRLGVYIAARDLVAIEDRLGVYIAARGSRVQIEGEPEAAARAREVLVGLYNRLDEGHDIDAGMVDAII